MSYRFANRLLASLHQTYVAYTIAVCTVKTPDDGQRNRPKHVEFYSKNKFEKLVHLVAFIIRIYHDAQSPERQNACFTPLFMALRCPFEAYFGMDKAFTQT